MYGQNLGGRPDAPGEPIFTKFCVRVHVPDMFLSFEFQKDRLKNVGTVGRGVARNLFLGGIKFQYSLCFTIRNTC